MTIFAATPWRNNAELIRDIAELGYIKKDDYTLDPTYGRGKWWDLWRPDNLVIHDLYTVDGVDFRELPEADGTFDVVAYDPPYVCMSLDTEILTKRGWLTWAEVKAGDYAYTLRHETGDGQWGVVEEVLVFPAASRRMLSMEGTSHSSLSTLDHRWPVIKRSGARTWETSSSLKSDDVVPIAAVSSDQPSERQVSDALVELIAWFWTEGTIDTCGYGHICQSRVANFDNCVRIESCLTELYGAPVDCFPRLGRKTDGVPRWRKTVDENNNRYWFSVDIGRELLKYAPNKVPSYDFLMSLTKEQLRLFIDVSVMADGSSHDGSLGQKLRSGAEAFQFACTLAGIPTTLTQSSNRGYVVHQRKRKVFKPSHNNPVEVEFDGPVWCVRTPNMSWLARRKGNVFFTGNCVGGRKTTTVPDLHDRFGLTNAPMTPREVQQQMHDGLAEMYRVVRKKGIILMKCQDYIWAGNLWEGATKARNFAVDKLGLKVVDRLEHVGTVRPQPHKNQVHARRNLSTMFVFRK